jgi:hypothetical protein
MSGLDHLSRAAEMSFTVARRVGSLALSTVRQVAGMALDRRSQGRPSETWAPPPPSSPSSPPPEPSAPDAPVPTPAAAAAAVAPAATAQPAAPAAAVDHVDREAVVVAESSDPGAADGAGAQIRIGEPWKGYGKLTAKEVNDRLATASPESLAVARLYETANRNRVTVLKEIDRRLAWADR